MSCDLSLSGMHLRCGIMHTPKNSAMSIIIDYQSWLQQPQYNNQNVSRRTLTTNGYLMKTFSPEWIIHEKILSQYQQQGIKAQTDTREIHSMRLDTSFAQSLEALAPNTRLVQDVDRRLLDLITPVIR